MVRPSPHSTSMVFDDLSEAQGALKLARRKYKAAKYKLHIHMVDTKTRHRWQGFVLRVKERGVMRNLEWGDVGLKRPSRTDEHEPNDPIPRRSREDPPDSSPRQD